MDGLGPLEHPQFWLIPPALCVLVAAHLNRRQLTESQMTTIRYACAIAMYTSSTADIFINGVARAPWLPLVLAGISILGIMAGILLRVRAFLYLGTSFLLVSLFTMIWYAAVELQRTWIWWVSGIVTGALIIMLFAIFEKRRDDVLRMVDELREWER
jgi:fructose-specific phosphotransferase system IIC component